MTYRLLSPARAPKPETEVVMECEDFYEYSDEIHHKIEGESHCRICGKLALAWTDSLTVFARHPQRCGDIPELP